MTRRKPSRGYTVVELLMALAVFTTGVTGIIAMQRTVIAANRHARNLTVANGIAQAWLDQLVADVGLTERLSHRPSELSGGQQQRVAIARALISKPTVLFADEPTGNLDSSTSAEILELLRRSVDEYGQTIVMVTHDARAAAAAHRVLFLADGQIVRELGECNAHRIHEVLEELAAAA